MAAALPAINLAGSNLSLNQTIHQKEIRTPPDKAKQNGPHVRLLVAPKRSQGKKEREMEQRQKALRAELSNMSKQQTKQYRNSYKHNLCLDMLRGGFHKSFAELFALMREQNAKRQEAGPESVLWNQVLLEDEPEKLTVLDTYLTRAESASRTANYEEVYQCQFNLARYFQNAGDKWLADHFFARCLATTESVSGDDGRMRAEAHCNVGLAVEEHGDFFSAADNFELFYNLCQDKSEWTFSEGEPMHYEASINLARIYTTIADHMESEGSVDTALEFLAKAYEMSQGGGDRMLEGEASYRLGVAYDKNGDPETGLVYLTKYLDICRGRDDSIGMGKCCQAMAKAFERQNKIEDSIRYLEMFVEVSEKSKDEKATSRACSNLGAMYNSLGRYEQAVEYFNKAYNISRALNDTEAISSSRVLFGVAAAHKMLENVSNHINKCIHPSVERLIEWKDNRGDDFDKPLQLPSAAPQDSTSSGSENKPTEQVEEKAKED